MCTVRRLVPVVTLASLLISSVLLGLSLSAGSPRLAHAFADPTTAGGVWSSEDAGAVSQASRQLLAPAAATVYVVPDVADCPSSPDPLACYDTVQEGVINVSAGGTVKVAAGIYTGASVITIAKTIVLRGGYSSSDWDLLPDPAKNRTVLDGGGSRRVLYIANASPTIEGFDIRNGLTEGSTLYGGGGIYVASGDPIIQNNRIYSNTASNASIRLNGGGLYIRGGSPSIRNNEIYANQALGSDNNGGGNGGGLYVHQGSARIENNTIHDNQAQVTTASNIGGGGGIFVNEGSSGTDRTTIRNNTIYANLVDMLPIVTAYQIGGGGIHLQADKAIVEQNTIYSNSVTLRTYKSGGGGILVGEQSNHARIRQNKIYNNTVTNTAADTRCSGGGGMYLFGAAEALVESNEIYANSAPGMGGGGLAALEEGLNSITQPSLQNNLVYSNTASNGGGVYISRGLAGSTKPRIVNNTIHGNHATSGSGGGIFIEYPPFGFPPNTASSASISNTLITSNTNDGIYNDVRNAPVTVSFSLLWNNGAAGNVVTASTLISDPLFVDLAKPDLRLQAGSPAIDTADPNNFPPTDIEGYTRPLDDGPDMGAYEFFVKVCLAYLEGHGIYPDLQSAIDASDQPTDVIKLSGECLLGQTISLNKTLTIRGGYDDEFHEPPELVAYPTSLNAMKVRRAMDIAGEITPTVEGLRITGGSASLGGGMAILSAAARLVNLTFSDNEADQGGGLYVEQANPTLLNTIFISNSATNGGGLYNSASAPTLVNATFYNNAVSGSGSGVYNAASSHASVFNSIFWGNAGAPIGSEAGSSAVVTYSLVQGGGWGGNLDVDPQFLDAPGGDLRLRATSPAIDAGINSAVPITYDAAGNPRFLDHPRQDTGLGTPPLVDMGAYETTATDLRVSKSVDVGNPSLPGLSAPGQTITYRLAFINAGDYDAFHVRITDSIPANLLSVNVTNTGAVIMPEEYTYYIWDVEDLAPGEGGVITVSGAIDPGLAESTGFANTASIGASTADTDAANSTSSVGVVALVLNDSPELAANTGMTLTGGMSAPILQAQLQVSDTDSARITYTLRAEPAYGQLQVSGAPLGVGGNFSQDDIDAGRLAYAHGANLAGHDVFTFTASDEGDPTARASVSSSGEGGNWAAFEPAMSADGRYVAFASDSDNLDPDCDNGYTHIFVRDRWSGQTTCVSRDSAGAQGRYGSSTPAISADGRYVAFASAADNLVGSDDNNNTLDVFVHDRTTGQTTRASVDSEGMEATGGDSFNPAISADGRYVAFLSGATNLVVSDTNTFTDTFVHDRATGRTARISVNSAGEEAEEGDCFDLAISADGRYVAFESEATNLVSGDTGFRDIFVHDRQTGRTTRVSARPDGNSYGDAYQPALSPDGRYVAFISPDDGLVGGADNGFQDVFVRDRNTGQIARASLRAGGGASNGDSYAPAISADGRYVAFESQATNLVSGDGNGHSDIFVRDRQAGQTTRVSLDSDEGEGNGDSFAPALSLDGRYIAFAAAASNLVANDTNGQQDVFVRDRGVIRAAFELAIQFPDLGIAKSVVPTEAVPGGQVVYALAFANSGQITATGVLVTDVVPAQVSVQSVVSSGLSITRLGSPPPYTWSVEDMAPGAAGWITLTGRLTSPLPAGLTVTNTAVITTAALDANPDDNQDEAVTTILPSQPEAFDDYGVTDEDSQLAVSAPGVLANDTDPNDDVLTVTAYDVASLRGVNVTVGADGSYTYDPRPFMQWLAASETLTDSFSYTASDGGLTDAATVWITVTGLNDAPRALPDSYTTDEDSVLSRDAANGVLANDEPVDTNDTMAVAAFGASQYGASVTINADGSFSYDPTSATALQEMPAGAVRTDTFTYTVADDYGESSTATIAITVTGVNDPPAAVDDTAYTLENAPVTLDVLANDSDVDGGTLSLIAVGMPANGQVAMGGGGWVIYTPTFDFYGTDGFTYTVGDGQGGFSLANVTVVITPLTDLVIDKRADPPYAFPGYSLSYHLAFSNTGHVTATGIVISDAIAYLTSPTFTASGIAVTSTGGTPYVWQVADMPPGTEGLIVVTGQLITGLVSGQTYTNTATITTTTPDRDPTSNTSSIGTKVPEADLILTKTVSPEPLVAGTDLVYTLTVLNLGPDDAYGLVLSDTLPPSTTFGLLDQVDSNDGGASPGFEDGTFQNTRWVNPRPGTNDDEWVELINTTLSGTFTSRVMDAGNVVAWDRLSWAPRRPTWKELPGGGRAETAYALGNANMGGNRILLHLNETAGTSFGNDSGLGDDGSCPAASGESCPTPGVEGRFNAALSFDGAQSNTVAISDTHNPVRYAIELWVRPAVVTDTSLILRTDVTGTQFSHLLGISNGRFVHSVNDGRERAAVGTTHVRAGTWYHLVGTAESGGDIKLYVNGRQEAKRDGIGQLWAGGDQYRLGSAYGPAGSTRYFSGELDEVAVYSRTLSASEVSDHYLRGALRLGLQVRSCNDAACAGEPFTGPGGSTQAMYSELSNTGLGLPTTVLSGVADNRYFQYQAIFFSDEPAYSPELRRVSVGPDHPTIAPSRGSCVTSGNPPAFTCTATSLPSGEVITVVARLGVDPSALGIITNTAVVTAITPDPSTPNTATVSSTVIALSNLVLGKDDWEDPVNLGGEIVYELHAHNYGPSSAQAVTLTDSLPAGLIGYPQPRGNWSCTPPANAITCTIPRLSVGEHWGVVLITATAPVVEGFITNTAWITTVTPVYTTTTLSAIERTRVTPLADLAIVKYAYPDPVDPGETLTYTIVVSNAGPYTATNVRVTDDLPANVSGITLYGGDWSCSLAGHSVTCDLPYPLPPDRSASFQIAATAPVSGLLINRASVTADTYDPDDTNNEVFVYSAVRAVADLSVSKADSPDPVYAGTPLTYTLVVTNAGPMPAGAFTNTLAFTNDRPMGIPWQGAAYPYRRSLNLSSIPGAIQDITVTLHGLSHEYPADLGVLLVGPDERSVVLMGNAGGGVDANDVTLAFNDAGIPLPISGTLSSTVTYQPTNYGLSEDFRQPAPAGPYGSSLSAFKGSSPNGFWRLYVYDYVESIGGEIAGGWSLHLVTRMITDRVNLTDTLPAGLRGVSVAAPSGWTCSQSGDQIICEAEQLGVNVPATFSINSTAPITGGVITNSVVISSTTIDLDPSANQSTITTTVIAVSDLGIAKAVEPAWVEPGARLTYTLSISNIGPSPIAGPVTVSDVLPAGLSDVSVSGGGWACVTSGLPSLLCTTGGLAVGPAPDILITANAPLTGGNTVITNTAGITASVSDPLPANNSALVTVTVGDLAIAGLQAFNDSPTILGNPTTLSATITAGTNVAFAWAFGDGQSGAGQALAHTYAATGTYTAIVTATNSRGSMTATTEVLVEKPAYAIFLPKVCKNCIYAPDLVVDSLVVTSRAVTVTIRNQGDGPVDRLFGNEFWVDVYINPTSPPTRIIPWRHYGLQGLAWGITQDALPLKPGAVLTLTAWWAGGGITNTDGGLYFRPDESTVTWTLPMTSQVWAQVDSIGDPLTTTFGVVLENHEIFYLEYNNIVGPQAPSALQSVAAVRQARQPVYVPLASALPRDWRLVQASKWAATYVRHGGIDPKGL